MIPFAAIFWYTAMPRPRVIRIGVDELLIADVMHRRKGTPVISGTFTAWLTDLDGNLITGSTVTLLSDPDKRGTWKGLLPKEITSSLTPGTRYILHYEFTSTNNFKINGRTEVEAIYNKIE